MAVIDVVEVCDTVLEDVALAETVAVADSVAAEEELDLEVADDV